MFCSLGRNSYRFKFPALFLKVHDNDIYDEDEPIWSDLDEVQRRVEAKTRAHMEAKTSNDAPKTRPSNIEPGFEAQYGAKRY
jgi:hypothetical protein